MDTCWPSCVEGGCWKSQPGLRAQPLPPGRQEGGWIELGTASLPSAGRVNANVLRIPTRTFLPFIAAATADKRLAFRGF